MSTIVSSAWPSQALTGGVGPRLLSRIHAKLERVPDHKLTAAGARFRPLLPKDEKDLHALHSEWFPVAYPPSFYEELFKAKSLIGLAAVADHNGEELLLGAVTLRVQWPQTRFDMPSVVRDGTAAVMNGTAIYIPTLGVVDRCRGRGIASQLLERSVALAQERRPDLQAIWLHVVDYNTPAMRLYERAGFRRVRRFPHFYHFSGRYWNSILLVRYFNGAGPPPLVKFRELYAEVDAFPTRAWYASMETAAAVVSKVVQFVVSICSRRRKSSK